MEEQHEDDIYKILTELTDEVADSSEHDSYYSNPVSFVFYQKTIESILSSEDPDYARATALDMISREIESQLWQPWMKSAALELSEHAKAEAEKLGGWSAEGLDWLGENGKLESIE